MTPNLRRTMLRPRSNETFLTMWGSVGGGDGQFNCYFLSIVFFGLDGIAVDGDGNVFVADTGGARVQKFACPSETTTTTTTHDHHHVEKERGD